MVNFDVVTLPDGVVVDGTSILLPMTRSEMTDNENAAKLSPDQSKLTNTTNEVKG